MSKSSKNAIISELIELKLVNFLSGENLSEDISLIFQHKRNQISQQEYECVIKKSLALKEAINSHLEQVGFIKNSVFWCARPDSITNIIGEYVDSKNNPSDLLLQSISNEWLGVSVKTTSGSRNVCFKNPGLGTVQRELGVTLTHIPKEVERIAIKTFNLSGTSRLRKKQIRSDKVIQLETQRLGRNVLTNIRNKLFEKLITLDQSFLREYLNRSWLNSSEEIFPKYFMVTCFGNCSVEIKSPTILTDENKHIFFSKMGSDSIGVIYGGDNIFKIRAKYSSEKLASAVKFSAEPL